MISPRPTGRSLPLLAIALVSLVQPFSGCDTAQPPAPCTVRTGTWAARFVLADAGAEACAEKPAERLSVHLYEAPDGGAQTVAIVPARLAARDDGNPGTQPYSLGAFAEAPDSEGLCAIEAPSVGRAVDAGAGLDLTYEWTQVKVVSRPEVPGTQLVANLHYTANGCTSAYEVWALTPLVFCRAEDGTPSDALCTGVDTGLPPEFDTVCDPAQGLCVPARRPPALVEASSAQ